METELVLSLEKGTAELIVQKKQNSTREINENQSF